MEVEVNDGCIKHCLMGHHTISGNISLFQIHLKLERWCKIAVCRFCDKTFGGCCTTRATAHILGCPILGQTKASIQTYVSQSTKIIREAKFSEIVDIAQKKEF